MTDDKVLIKSEEPVKPEVIDPDAMGFDGVEGVPESYKGDDE